MDEVGVVALGRNGMVELRTEVWSVEAVGRVLALLDRLAPRLAGPVRAALIIDGERTVLTLRETDMFLRRSSEALQLDFPTAAHACEAVKAWRLICGLSSVGEDFDLDTPLHTSSPR